MGTERATLYQFAGSHFCEKARFALDYKRVDFRVINLVPGPHRRTARRLAPATSLPILLDGGNVTQGSAAIIDHLDKRFRERPLTPSHSQDRSMAYEWERYLDRNLGATLRVLFYFHAFRDRSFVRDFLLRDGPWWGRPFFACAYPVIKRSMLKSMSISPANAERAQTELLHAVDRLDERVHANKYLAGPHFSRADLTAAALLFHQWDPDWTSPPAIAALMSTLAERPFYRWAAEVYATHRKPGVV
jgi:glutathione S-transferase